MHINHGNKIKGIKLTNLKTKDADSHFEVKLIVEKSAIFLQDLPNL